MSLFLLKLFFGNHIPLPQVIKLFNLLGLDTEGCPSSLRLCWVPTAHPTRAISQPVQPSPVGTRSTQEPNTSNEPTKYSSQLMRSVFTASVQASQVPTKSLQS